MSGASSSTGGESTGGAFTLSFDYSLPADVLLRSDSSHSGSHTVHLHQVYDKKTEQREGGLPPCTASVRNVYTAAGTVNFNFSGGQMGLSGTGNQTSTQTFGFTDSLGDCYKAELTAEGGKVKTFSEVQGCNAKQLHWFVHPAGLPGTFDWHKHQSRWRSAP